MRAVVVRSFGGPEALETVEVPVPTTGAGQVRIRVEAAAVNPVDAVTRSGQLAAAGLMAPRDVTGIGWDVAGVVDKAGAGVTAFVPGDRVTGLRDRLDVSLGTYAEYVVLDAAAVAPAPSGVLPAEAATLPLGGLTALQALDALALEPGSTLLVTGAAGAVGGFTVELAAQRGIHVVASAGTGDEDFVRTVGARWFVPRSDGLADRVRELVPQGVDAVADAAVTGVRALGAVRNRGAFVSVVAGAAPFPLRGISVTEHWVAADGAGLARLSDLAGSGRLTLRVADTMPLAEAARAHRRLAEGGMRGRLVLVP
ncbi:NADPH:quinone reductase-like Zn-dependent oxidoreductase [Streptomyces olivoverticillatus]|uniref:NADPH:quinone reductase-like Zn-dependent oxidoreductase n=1 Tax=Streptomyces olivoverticillatus TaxID=66427 RepID=A0A7W7LLG5_9ACTN|nr:NADP-dependent oxidoreductase [Streptomyces olivoverticillatus]MBB4892420.1 NADPH:quinone reductase-like Zn-dependent oxidoreductase [Streptomyces olivoverticillatus]